jgi:hypothetical protein
VGEGRKLVVALLVMALGAGGLALSVEGAPNRGVPGGSGAPLGSATTREEYYAALLSQLYDAQEVATLSLQDSARGEQRLAGVQAQLRDLVADVRALVPPAGLEDAHAATGAALEAVATRVDAVDADAGGRERLAAIAEARANLRVLTGVVTALRDAAAV